jgi:hypothetical protein
MRRLQTIVLLTSVCFLINSCAQKRADAAATKAPAGECKKGAACCTVSSRTKSMTSAAR